MATFIDVHSHIDKLEGTPEEAVAKALAAGVQKIITIGTEPADHPVVIELAEKFSPHVFCTLGYHPHEGSMFTDEGQKFIEDHLHHPRVVAIGEIGLDYYYNHSDKQHQLEAFDKQMDMAARYKMPVEIHTRDAEEDTVEILKKYSGKVTGLIHCFTGTQWLADQALALGYHISISGVVTFKNANALRDVVKTIPMDRLHIETDAPFLAPVPMRGQKNTSAYLIYTANFIAELKGVSHENLSEQTFKNLKSLMPKFY
jgi:TatD DNase family protein